jgi:hypothetical protein
MGTILPHIGRTPTKIARAFLLISLVLTLPESLSRATDRFVSSGGGNLSPFASWDTAATNIQDAIDAASAGDVIWVTNGVYSTGGKVMAGGLTNRVALDKALTVQSVNGWTVTIIQGAWDSSYTNGSHAIRCAWLTNGAILSGFTLRGGATWGYSVPDQNGGGVWGASTNASVCNCVITNNVAVGAGGGAYQVTLNYCTLTSNSVTAGTGSGAGGGAANSNLKNCVVTQNSVSGSSAQGGGVNNCVLRNCAITKNLSAQYGGGVYGGALFNCTVTKNLIYPPHADAGYGANGARLTNCIVYANGPAISGSNYYSCSLGFCCAAPLSSGAGNISADPQLLTDGIHLAASSPCRGVGLAAAVTGADLDGQPWGAPPCIGCDEWQAAPLFIIQPKAQSVGGLDGVSVGGVVAAGQDPFSYYWSKDGTVLENGPKYSSADTTNLIVNGFDPVDAGNYQVVVSNAFGMVTSQVVRVAVHCVDAAGVGPVPPFSTWAAASTNIQTAIDAASEGDFVLATNGVYAAGGKVMAGDLTNRVAVDKALTVMSVNGLGATVIQGAWDPIATNGPGAVRCVWLTNGAALNGFTLQGGATRSTGDTNTLQSGGAVWSSIQQWRADPRLGPPVPPTILNCQMMSNAAAGQGGGAYDGVLSTCGIFGNHASLGGGVSYAYLMNCAVAGNSALSQGGGTYESSAINCTIVSNSAPGYGGGAYAYNSSAVLINSIIYFNTGSYYSNCYSPIFLANRCCTTQEAVFSIAADPQLVDGVHLAVTSPCRGAGWAAYTYGTDIDGESWASPHSIGCDEVWEAAIAGPLSVGLSSQLPMVAERGYMPLCGTVTGRASRLGWSFGDGSILTNGSYLNTSYAWTNAGDYTVTFTAFNTDNPAGVSTNLVVHVIPWTPPVLSFGGLSGTNFTLNFPGQPGVIYIVEQTTNLAPPVVWRTVATLSSTGDLVQVTDTKATNAARFYRVRTP